MIESSSANIINLNTVDIQSWIKGANNIYIGRRRKELKASKWKNPYPIDLLNNREKVLKLFEKYIKRKKNLVYSVGELKGKRLGCWCAPKRCHAELLHRLAGNIPIYQSSAKTHSHTLDMENTSLDQKVAEALNSMNNILENIGQDISNTRLSSDSQLSSDEQRSSDDAQLSSGAGPSILLDAASPIPSSLEMREVYETLLESRSSLSNISNEKDVSSDSRTFLSPASLPLNSTEKVTNTERFELESKLRSWRLKQSKSLYTSPCASPLGKRETCSAPASPGKQLPDETIAPGPPSPFFYLSSTLSDPDCIAHSERDTTKKILTFLANKVDILSVSVNTLQFNLKKLSETFQVSVDEKIPKTVRVVEESLNNNFTNLEDKFDNYQKMMDKKYKEVVARNEELSHKLDDYISKETERNECMFECFNSPQNVPNCIADLQPLKDEMNKKISELDYRLVECEQYSRRESLVISGIPDAISKDQKKLQSKVIDILSLIGLKIIPDDISACHRLYSPPNSAYPARIIVRFVNRKIVNFCLDHRDDLQKKASDHLRLNLRFFESLCAKNEESLRICKLLNHEQKIHNHFLRNGFVKVVMEENGRPMKIKHPDFLREKFPDIPVVV